MIDSDAHKVTERVHSQELSEPGARNEICVWILGLIHSGTTVFWRSWRKDRRFLCFDEPFTVPSQLPGENHRGTSQEFMELLRRERDPRAFWQRFAPLHPLEELDSAFREHQEDYFRYLLEQSPRLVIDETHLHLHLAALAKLAPHAHVIHLYRRARGFVTSHLRPTWSSDTTWDRRLARRVRHEWNKLVFWTRDDYVPGMIRGDVIGRHPQSKFGLMLTDAGYDTERIMAAPTIVRLLAYWHYHYHYIECEGPRLFGERFTRVRYEDFATDPTATMARLYGWIGLPPPEDLSFPEVHPPKLPYRPRDRRWREAARTAGFTDDEIETLL